MFRTCRQAGIKKIKNLVNRGNPVKKVPPQAAKFFKFNKKNSSMHCIGVNKIKIHFDTSQLCCGVVHFFGNPRNGGIL